MSVDAENRKRRWNDLSKLDYYSLYKAVERVSAIGAASKSQKGNRLA